MSSNGNGYQNGNGHVANGNGHGTNGKSKVATATEIAIGQNLPKTAPAPVASDSQPTETQAEAKFDRPVLLRQSKFWSRGILWTLVGATTLGVIWAFVAQIDEAVPTQGKLEPIDSVKEIQAPVGGVVKEVLVKEGQVVEKDQLLVNLDPTVADAGKASFQNIRNSLIKENAFYRAQLAGLEIAPDVVIPSEQLALTRNRSILLEENRLFRMQLFGVGSPKSMSAEERSRLQAGRLEIDSRTGAAEQQVRQLERQLAQAKSDLQGSRDLYAIDNRVLKDYTTLTNEGGLARVQMLQQQQRAISRQTEIAKLEQEIGRVEAAIAEAKNRVQNTVGVSMVDLHNRIAENEKRIGEIDSQLNKTILENLKRIAEIDKQVAENEQTLRYQAIKAPVAGTVFDLKAGSPGFVIANTEPILKVVPKDGLVAKVYLTNKDIGFVKVGMPVDVRIDSFPFNEFGDIKGVIEEIGSDALPPDQIHQYYRFPVKVRLNQQYLKTGDKQITLQSGMSVTGNVKIRKRSVASLFTDLFTKQIESLETVR